VLNLERVHALATWLKTTNTKLIQVNGQRKYGGPPEGWDGPNPGARCEVFISNIPRDAYEDLLIPLFSSVGSLWEFRLMMNFSGENRGFAYAKYGSSSVAADAIRVLNGHVLEAGSCINVRYSTEKRHLCINQLPVDTKQEELLKVVRAMVEGVDSVSLKAGPGINGVSAIVAFSSHHAASMAKKILAEAFKKQFALNIFVKWQIAVKPSLDEPLLLEASPLKRPCLFLTPSQRKAPPPRLTSQTPNLPTSCRAVGGPTAPPSSSSSSSSSSQGHDVSVPLPATLLQKLCEMTGFSQPLYELHYSYTGPDGFLHFTYKVRIPGITLPFTGAVMILPGPSVGGLLEEAQQAAAQQVLHRIYSTQL
ncbi:dead end protein-like 1, partial [Solea senegalensis]